MGSQFVSRGLKTYLSCSMDNLQMPPEDAEVWIINTGSRSLAPKDAASRVKKALQALKEFKVDYIYKKIDSTLRGNIGSELEASLAEMQLDSIPLCAAFPEMGRTTVDGVHYIGGKIITDTQYAKDTNTPVKEADINKLLASQMESPEKINVQDASSPSDMVNICRRGRGSFFAGAAAYAGSLADTWMASKRSPEPVVFSPAPVLIVSGSLNPLTRQQINYYKKAVEDSGSGDMIITTPSRKQSGALKKTVRRAKKIFSKSFTRALLTGGETAEEFLKELGVDNMEIISSPMIGISLAAYEDYLFILKPGGFGKKDILVKLSALLGGR